MPHIAYPIAVAPNGRLAAHDDDAPAAVRESLALLFDTRPGERRSVPDYGLGDYLFTARGVDPDTVAEVAAEWEERADPIDVETVHHAYQQTLTVTPRQGVS